MKGVRWSICPSVLVALDRVTAGLALIPQSQIQLSQTAFRGIVFGRCGGILGLRAALEPDERDTAAGLSIGVAKADGMSHHNSACVCFHGRYVSTISLVPVPGETYKATFVSPLATRANAGDRGIELFIG